MRLGHVRVLLGAIEEPCEPEQVANEGCRERARGGGGHGIQLWHGTTMFVAPRDTPIASSVPGHLRELHSQCIALLSALFWPDPVGNHGRGGRKPSGPATARRVSL
jgi:hypothetical protein